MLDFEKKIDFTVDSVHTVKIRDHAEFGEDRSDRCLYQWVMDQMGQRI